MNEESLSPDPALVSQGRRYHRWLMAGALLLNLGLLAGEASDLHDIGFVIAGLVLLTVVLLLFLRSGQTGKLRWGLFMALLLNGAYGFLLGGLHLSDPKEQATDPLCYLLSALGLGLVGLGGYFVYSNEIDAFLRQRVADRGGNP